MSKTMIPVPRDAAPADVLAGESPQPSDEALRRAYAIFLRWWREHPEWSPSAYAEDEGDAPAERPTGTEGARGR